jgi:hypothetical protein
MWISTEYLAGINSQRESTMRYYEQIGIGRYMTAEKTDIENMRKKVKHTLCKNHMTNV